VADASANLSVCGCFGFPKLVIPSWHLKYAHWFPCFGPDMQDLPHHYNVSARADSESLVVLSSPGLASIETAGPPEFGGPGGVWSPETLLVAAVADCFILSFRAIARASGFEWRALDCAVSGTLDKIDRVTQFTDLELVVELTLPADSDERRAHRLLEKAERSCLVTNSMTATTHLHATLRNAD
jgi:organic hydroperoxide reductase OsmC/OhrA